MNHRESILLLIKYLITVAASQGLLFGRSGKKSRDLADSKYGIHLGREKGFLKVRKSPQIPQDTKR